MRERKRIRLRGQAVKTSPFHGGNTGSIPVGVTQKGDDNLIIWRDSQVVRLRSATPLSPVQIRFAPLKISDFYSEIFFFLNLIKTVFRVLLQWMVVV